MTIDPETIPHGKTALRDASVYIHVPAPDDDATVTHIDVCHPAVSRIVRAGDDDATYFGTTSHGGFIGLRRPMIRMAQRVAQTVTEQPQCPVCDTAVAQSMNYCFACGQALDAQAHVDQ